MVNSYIVWYLFLAGVGSGAFFLGGMVDAILRFYQGKYLARIEALTTGGLYLGPAAVIVGSIFLLADLGSPERAFQVFFTPSASLLTIGSWFVGLFCFCSVASLAVGNMVDSPFARRIELVLHVFACVFAFGVMLYSGLYLSSFETVPFLHSAFVPAIFVVSALSTGLALILAFGFVMQDCGEIAQGISSVVRIDTVILVVEAVLIGAFLVSSYFSNEMSRVSVEVLVAGRWCGLFWLGVVLVGVLAPLCIGVMHDRFKGKVLFALGAGCVLVGGLCLRYALLLAALRYSAIGFGAVSFWG